MRVYVTQQDINEGEPGQGEKCAVALALKRIGFCQVFVAGVNDYTACIYTRDKFPKKFWLSREVTAWLRRFDILGMSNMRHGIEPISFDVPGLEKELPPPEMEVAVEELEHAHEVRVEEAQPCMST